MVASHRQSRPQLPKDWCPFCVGSGKVPDGGFDVYRYPNDFPALSAEPPVPDDVAASELFMTEPAYGRCEVLLYADRHNVKLSDLTDDHVHKLARMWLEVFKDFSNDPKIKYVFIFENRGEVVGVTMPHPHGQAYGYPFIPRVIREELAGAGKYYKDTGNCLFCELLAQERKDKRRIIRENEYFTLYTPFYAQTAYATHITAKRHVENITQMTDMELDALGEIVRDASAMYDQLFNMPFPYMMCMHNAPVSVVCTNAPSGGDPSYSAYFHFHIEFIPPMRAADKQQFFASSETGAGAWCNPTCPEEKAEELKAAMLRVDDIRQAHDMR